LEARRSSGGYTAGPKHAGAPGRPLIWSLFKPTFRKLFFGVEQGRRTFLRTRARIVDNFRRNYFACGKLEFTCTIFGIIPLTSELSVWPALYTGPGQ